MRPPARLPLAAVAATLVLTGCGSASEPSPPSGVDELVVPTPSIDPADFGAAVDNRWLPLAPGSKWSYRAGDRTVIVTVLDAPRDVQGVPATVVETVDLGRRTPEATRAWYAQDDRGNVWQLGEEGVWEAGVNGAQAGLAMPARPRVGDGFRKEYAAGVAEDRALVVGLDGSASVPYGDLTGLLETEDSSPLEPGAVELRSYARDVGLVRIAGTSGDDEGDEQLVLVAFAKG